MHLVMMSVIDWLGVAERMQRSTATHEHTDVVDAGTPSSVPSGLHLLQPVISPVQHTVRDNTRFSEGALTRTPL